MLDLIRQLLSLLTRRQRAHCALLLGAMMLRAVAQLAGVASIVPFISIVADPDIIRRNDQLRWLYERGGFETDIAFLTAAGIGVIAALAFSNGISALTTLVTRRFVARAEHQLSVRLLRGYLAQPYAFFVNRNSATLSKNILSEVSNAVGGVLMPSLNIVAQVMVILAMAGLLIVVDPVLVLTVVIVLGGAYSAIYFSIRRRQARLGRIRKDSNKQRFKVASEAFGGIKDVKVLQRESEFLARFVPHSRRYNDTSAANAAVQQLPRYLLETVAFSSIIVVVLYYLRAGGGVGDVLPVISLFAVASYRMMPAIQTLFADLVGIRFKRAALDDLAADLAWFEKDTAVPVGAGDALTFCDALHLDRVSFRYEDAAAPALLDVSLSIGRNQMVGLVGGSGSGKTTLVDLLLGLYEPQDGAIRIDSVPLDRSTTPAWRRQVGYVPQHIYLTDSSLAENIAFGIPPKQIDTARVEEVSRIANLHDFILTCPDRYDTMVGERGVRLSGGQRQRIGIARALYHDPVVLIMDEATSALDGATEDAVMEAIGALAGKKTVILIAHRLSTVQECDRIFVLDSGRLVDQGTFAELLVGSSTFRAMAKLEPEGSGSVSSARTNNGSGDVFVPVGSGAGRRSALADHCGENA
jgi:ATP-binding cassette, subfamily B, bacterial PglK